MSYECMGGSKHEGEERGATKCPEQEAAGVLRHRAFCNRSGPGREPIEFACIGAISAQSSLWSWGSYGKRITRRERRCKNASAAIPNARTTAICNSWASTEVREHIHRMDRHTPMTAPTMERTMLLLCSSTSASR